MRIDISEFYKNKGYDYAYLLTNNENRKMVCMRKKCGKRTTISYAKYLYTSHYNCDVDSDCQVDHINGDKTDDRIENLQVISKCYNIKKDHQHKTYVMLKCPICGNEFLFEARNLSTHSNPCCSRSCGGKQSHITKKENLMKKKNI